MATAKILCAGDGCRQKITITGMNRSDVARKAEYLEGKRLCDDCHKKELQAENATQAEKNAELGMPELNGSPKQVLWAEGLRYKTVATMQGVLSNFKTLSANSRLIFLFNSIADALRQSGINKHTAQDAMDQGALLDCVLKMYDTRTDASWWIENQELGDLGLEIGAHLVNWIKAKQGKAEVRPDETTLEHQARIEAIAEATIFPDSPITQNPVLIEVSLHEVVVTIDPTIAECREVMKSSPFSRYALSNRYSVQGGTEKMGSVYDRATQIAAQLLEAKLPIRMFSEQARTKLLNADYEPYQKEWISHGLDGSIVIPHFYNDSLYTTIRKIKGSKWNAIQKRCEVPASAYEDILGFAEVHGYKVTGDVLKELEDAKQVAEMALLNPASITAKKAEQKPRRAKRPTLSKDMAPVAAADGLLDDE